MKLGDLIDTLAAMPPEATVHYSDGRVPRGFNSWRGVYSELTLSEGYGEWNGESWDKPEPITVAELVEKALAADGGTFEGYKGGDFTMDRHTPVWADEAGAYGSIGIMGVTVQGGKVILRTADLSDYR